MYQAGREQMICEDCDLWSAKLLIEWNDKLDRV